MPWPTAHGRSFRLGARVPCAQSGPIAEPPDHISTGAAHRRAPPRHIRPGGGNRKERAGNMETEGTVSSVHRRGTPAVEQRNPSRPPPDPTWSVTRNTYEGEGREGGRGGEGRGGGREGGRVGCRFGFEGRC